MVRCFLFAPDPVLGGFRAPFLPSYWPQTLYFTGWWRGGADENAIRFTVGRC